MSDANDSSNTKTRDAESMKQKYNAKVARWPPLAQPWTIHRVPHSIRAVDKDAYEPKMLSIGPYHRSNPNLHAMEDHKWRYVQAIIGRNPWRELSDYLEEMKGLEVEVRNFYSENIDITSKEFVEMMLLDGCFIVELLLLNVKNMNATAETDDPIYSTKWILPIIRLDMLLLENQLPFLVLKHIFQLVNGTNTSSSIVELALRFFEHLMPMKKKIPSANSIPHSMNSIHHLLHLFHQHLSPTPPQSDTTDQGGNTSVAIDQDNRSALPLRSMMSASDLRYLLPLRKKESALSIADVKIKGGHLEIPTLSINHLTNSVLRNLIAWEHCYPKCGAQLTSYVFLMDCLIDSPEDVAILKHLNIIEHWSGLGNNEAVALLFNQMCIGITYDWKDNFVSNLFEQVLKMKSGSRTKWWYIMRRDYYPRTWKWINSQIAIMTVYLAIAQILIALFPTGKKNS